MHHPWISSYICIHIHKYVYVYVYVNIFNGKIDKKVKRSKIKYIEQCLNQYNVYQEGGDVNKERLEVRQKS